MARTARRNTRVTARQEGKQISRQRAQWPTREVQQRAPHAGRKPGRPDGRLGETDCAGSTRCCMRAPMLQGQSSFPCSACSGLRARCSSAHRARVTTRGKCDTRTRQSVHTSMCARRSSSHASPRITRGAQRNRPMRGPCATCARCAGALKQNENVSQNKIARRPSKRAIALRGRPTHTEILHNQY